MEDEITGRLPNSIPVCSPVASEYTRMRLFESAATSQSPLDSADSSRALGVIGAQQAGRLSICGLVKLRKKMET
jgi:hypothetical protein